MFRILPHHLGKMTCSHGPRFSTKLMLFYFIVPAFNSLITGNPLLWIEDHEQYKFSPYCEFDL